MRMNVMLLKPGESRGRGYNIRQDFGSRGKASGEEHHHRRKRFGNEVSQRLPAIRLHRDKSQRRHSLRVGLAVQKFRDR